MLDFSKLIPVRFSEKDLMEGEKIIRLIQRHNFFLVKKMFWITIFTILVWIGTIYMSIYLKTVSSDIHDIMSIATIIFFIIANIYYLFRFLYVWIDHHFDNVIITNFRTVYIDRHFIYGQSVKEITLDRITTVRSRIDNIVANLLGYARLDIDSADDGQHITFEYTPNVMDIRAIIMKQKEIFTGMHARGEIKDDTDNISPLGSDVLKDENMILKDKIRQLEEKLNSK